MAPSGRRGFIAVSISPKSGEPRSNLDHPDRAHRLAEKGDPEQLARGGGAQQYRQRPQLHDGVQAVLVIGHDGHLRPAAQPYPGPSAEAPALRLVDDLGREHGDLAVVLVSNNT
jgi:hypothetical protein